MELKAENFGSNPKFSLDKRRRKCPAPFSITKLSVYNKVIAILNVLVYNKLKKERKGD